MKGQIEVNILPRKDQPPFDLKKEKKVLVTVCPSFKVDEDSLILFIKKPTRPSKTQLLACADQIGAEKLHIFLGFGLLYWDYLFLNSICSLADYQDMREKNSKSLESDSNPQASKWKNEAKEREKNWLKREMKDSQCHDLQFICSGDLLDNPECKALYHRLNGYTASNTKLKNLLEGLSNKFIKNHFANILKKQKNWVYKYNKDIPLKTILEQYMQEYIRYEFSIFVYLAFQGFPVILSSVHDEHFYILDRVMECFSTSPLAPAQSSLPTLSEQQRMRGTKIEFKGESSSPSESPPRAYLSDPSSALPPLKLEAIVNAMSREELLDCVARMVIISSQAKPRYTERLITQALLNSRNNIGDNENYSPPPSSIKKVSSNKTSIFNISGAVVATGVIIGISYAMYKK